MPAVSQVLRTLSDYSRSIALIVGGGTGTAVLIALAILGEARLAFAAAILTILLGLASLCIRWAILGAFVYLTLLGDIRRWILPFDAWSGADPLLVVGPVTAIVLWTVAFNSGRVDFDTPLSRWILLLMGIMSLQIFNPIQGGLMVGMTGAMFLIVPLLWYWVGKSFGTEELLRTFFFRLVVPLACIAALLGFYQVAFGYPEYQLEWYRVGGYSALGPSEEYLRPLSVFPNITEYAKYLGYGILILLVPLLRKRGSWLSALTILGLFLALFLTGTRGPVLLLIITGAILWTILGKSIRTWVPRLSVALLIGVFGLVYGLSSVGEMKGDSRAHFNIQRQANLIPENGTGGTIAIHLNLVRIAGVRTLQQPLGHGLGYVTLAASRFGDGGFSSEKDFTDMFIALGVPGGIIYLIVQGYTTLLAIAYWRRTRSTVGLIVTGILLFSVFSWLRPGQYVATPLVWFCVGSLDRIQADHRTSHDDS